MLTTRIVAITLLAALPIAACDDAREVSTKNFADTISSHLDHYGEQCLGVEQWPVDVREGVFGLPDRAKMEALRAVGLVRSEPVEEDFSDPRYSVTRFSLTADAAPFVREREIDTADGDGKLHTKDLCWGWMELDKVIGWNGPTEVDHRQQADVTYTYRMNGVADWAKGTTIQSAFPEVGALIYGEGIKERVQTVTLTDDGWVAVLPGVK